jgi:outer membrane receptor protein involved in Fe transport
MRQDSALRGRALATASFIGLACALATPAAAQGSDASQPEDLPVCEPNTPEGTPCRQADAGGAPVSAEQGASGSVTVTGSRIRRPNLESTVPITSIGGDQIFQGADPNVGEVLNELPQLRSTFAQQNPGLGIGIAGLNLLDLRGLGTQRTLVLVNGRRHVAADILNNAVSPDVGSFPADLIERVDIVTGGNSAIYGSDAIAGVVNFVLRRDFQGLQIRGQAGITEEGFGGNQFVALTAGQNFADDRGNVALALEYSRQDRIFGSDVPAFRQNNGLFVVDADVGGLPNGSDGVPDRVFIRDVRSGTINFNGLVPVNQRNVANAGACGNATSATNGQPNTAGPAFNCTFIFLPDGRLVPQTGARFGTSINPAFIGGNGATGREFEQLSVLPFLERFNANLLARFEVSPALELFLEAKFARLNALGNNASPSFIQTPQGNQGNVGDFRERPRLDNPFLNPEARALLAGQILASGCNTDLLVTCPAGGNLTAAQIAAVNDGSYRFLLARNLLDVGIRDEDFRRDTYRVVVGARGTFNTDWSYELSVNYGRFEQSTVTTGFIDRQRFSLSIDAGRNPVTGQIQCRSQFDPASALVLQRTDAVSAAILAQNQARLQADIAACVPYNPFGSPDNRAAVAYFSADSSAEASLSQLVVSGFVSGDTSDFFELPGGPVRFAVGGEYRRETAFYDQDDFNTNGFTNNVSIPLFDPDPFEVKEAFAEIQIPILRDVPFFHELTLTGAGRIASYQGATGEVLSYNAGVDWAPVQDLRLRGNYSRAVRAPNVSETGFPLVPNFAPGFVDPCNPTPRNANANRAANCLADLGAATLATFTDVAPSLPIVSGSNPNLTEETSDSYTLGGVFQPRFIPGLSLSVDYYHITVNDIIASLGAQAIVNACYDGPNLNSVFCQSFQRNRTGTPNASGDAPGRIVSNSLIQAPLNFASRVREGIDVNFNYRTNISNDVRLTASVIYTHNLTISNFQDQTNPNFENRILGELGDPGDEFRADLDLTFGPFTLGYRLRYIGPMFVNAYEDFFPLNEGQPGATPEGGSNADFAVPRRFPIVTYSDLRFEWNLSGGSSVISDRNDLRFYFGVDNVFDQLPPLGSTATGAGSAIYDYRGRSFYAGFRARF